MMRGLTRAFGPGDDDAVVLLGLWRIQELVDREIDDRRHRLTLVGDEIADFA